MKAEKLLTEDEHKEEIERIDNDVWSDYEAFDEIRDDLDLKPVVLSVVVGTYTHPSGAFSKNFLSDTASSLIWDYLSEWVPETLSQDDRRKFGDKIMRKVVEQSEALYDEVHDSIVTDTEEGEKLNDDLSDSDVDDIIEEEYDRMVDDDRFRRYF